jgi:hypothetical protein
MWERSPRCRSASLPNIAVPQTEDLKIGTYGCEGALCNTSQQHQPKLYPWACRRSVGRTGLTSNTHCTTSTQPTRTLPFVLRITETVGWQGPGGGNKRSWDFRRDSGGLCVILCVTCDTVPSSGLCHVNLLDTGRTIVNYCEVQFNFMTDLRKCSRTI